MSLGRACWAPVPDGSHFPVQNLPYGVFASRGEPPRVGVAIGANVLDLAALAEAGLFGDAGPASGAPVAEAGTASQPLLAGAGTAPPRALAGAVTPAGGWAPRRWFASRTLNAFMAAGPATWQAVRARVTGLLCDPGHRDRVRPHLIPQDAVRLLLPFEVADYVDFYSSRDHAITVGRILRPGSPPLPRNWLHLPMGYHGRAGSVVVSGTPIIRPHGQRRPPQAREPQQGREPHQAFGLNQAREPHPRREPRPGHADGRADGPVFGPTERLDFEAEAGFVTGVPSRMGQPVAPGEFRRHVFGFVLVNDWSARDIQSFEYQPLGPFLGKSFATSVSPWVVPVAALEAARVPPPAQVPEPPAYLRCAEPWGLDVTLEVAINGHVISRPPLRHMYWSAPQQLAHATINGAPVRTGDLYATGTVSGPGQDERGCLLELTQDGAQPVTLPDGTSRRYLLDGDVVRISATAPGTDGATIGFGAVEAEVQAAVAHHSG